MDGQDHPGPGLIRTGDDDADLQDQCEQLTTTGTEQHPDRRPEQDSEREKVPLHSQTSSRSTGAQWEQRG